MSSFSKFFLCATLFALMVYPWGVARYGWGMGTERDARIIAAAQANCAPEFRDTQGKCIVTSRSIHMRRSFFGGSEGHGK